MSNTLVRRITATRLRSASLTVTAAAALATVGLATAQPASALTGTIAQQGYSVNDSTAQKVVQVSCPSGTKAVGGSAVIGGSTKVGINTLVPGQDANGNTSVTVLAREQHGGTTEAWQLIVTAQCAPANRFAGLEYVKTSSVFDSAASHSVIAACSPGKKLVGLGGLVDSQGPGQDSIALSAIRPALDLGSVAASASEVPTGYTGPWRTAAVAVCAAPLAGLTQASTSTPSDTTNTKRATAACPAGTTVLSGGFDLGTASGRAEVGNAFLDPDLSSDPSRQGFETQAHENTANGGTWRDLSIAICAT